MRLYQNELMFLLNKNISNLNWNKNTSVSNMRVLCYDSSQNKYFATYSINDSIGKYIISSTNGLTWTEQGENSNLAKMNAWQDVTVGEVSGSKKFVMLGYSPVSGTAGGYISTSSDFSTWTSPARVANLSSGTFISLAYGNGIFVAINDRGQYSTSTNGTTWTSATYLTNPASVQRCMQIIYENSMFIIVCSDGAIFTSTNGTSWTNSSNISAQNFSSSGIQFYNNKYIAVGGEYYTISLDFINWTTPKQDINLAGGLLKKSNDKILSYNSSTYYSYIGI